MLHAMRKLFQRRVPLSYYFFCEDSGAYGYYWQDRHWWNRARKHLDLRLLATFATIGLFVIALIKF